jgi:uncharacterized membrane protein
MDRPRRAVRRFARGCHHPLFLGARGARLRSQAMNVAREPDAPDALLDHVGLATRRVIVGAVLGCAAAAVALEKGASWSVGALCATDVAALVFVVWVWAAVWDADAIATKRMARTEDASRVAAESVLVGAGAASLVAVVFTLAQAGDAAAPARGLLTALAVGSVALAWTSVHTVYVLRYARLFYSPPEGGIDFGSEAPGYADFAYLALTIGMTFQVSDTDLTGKRVRRVALRHALLSYLFGTVIVAITVSSVAGLLGNRT